VLREADRGEADFGFRWKHWESSIATQTPPRISVMVRLELAALSRWARGGLGFGLGRRSGLRISMRRQELFSGSSFFRRLTSTKRLDSTWIRFGRLFAFVSTPPTRGNFRHVLAIATFQRWPTSCSRGNDVLRRRDRASRCFDPAAWRASRTRRPQAIDAAQGGG